MSIPHWSRHQSKAVLFVLAMLVAVGILSFHQLPVLLFPHVSFPRVRISLDAGDRPAPRMLIEVARPVEEAVRGIPGVTGIRSTTSRGSADVNIRFNWGHDMTAAALQTNAAISQIMNKLPPGTKFEVRRMDPTVFPVIAYSLTSDSKSLVDLRQLALYKLRPALFTVPGVAKVSVQSADQEEWRVVVDEGKLRSLGLRLSDVAKALSSSNVLTAIGHLQQDDRLYLVVSDTRIKALDQIRSTIIRSGSGGVVHVSDIADVRRDVKPQWISVTADGKPAVLLNIYQQPGGNTVQIARAVRQKLKSEQANLPELKGGAVKVANWYDQSNLILKSEGSVRDAIAVGIGLAAIVLFVFLRSWKITLIATLAVPAVLAVTLLLLRIMGESLNIMTLGGMAAAVGLIIDDGIVLVEHIMRRLRSRQGAHHQRIVEATVEFTKPLAGSSTSTIIIFAPLALLSGVTGAFFKALSLTMAASLAISFVVAWAALPVMSGLLLGQREADRKQGGRLSSKLNGLYVATMRRALDRRWLVPLLAVPLLAAGYVAFGHVKSGFMPSIDEGGFVLDYHTPPGTSLAETDRELRQVEAILSAEPTVDTYSRRTGLQLGGGVTEANQGDFFVRLKGFPRPPISQVMDDVRQKIEHKVPTLSIELSQLMEDLIGDLTGVPEPVDIKLFSPDEQQLRKVANKVAQAISGIKGVVEVKNGIVPAGDALEINVDRTKAALEGVDPRKVTSALDAYVSGTVPTRVHVGQRLIGVRVWVPSDLHKTTHDLKNLRIAAADGHLVPLERIASLKVINGQPQIDRENLKRMAGVTARIAGRDLGSTMADVKSKLTGGNLIPKGMTYQLGGTYQQQQKSFQGLLRVMIAALLLVFALLLFLYRSFRVAGAMMAIIALALSAIFVVLWGTGTEMNIMSIMGMTMIVGIVTEVSIFYYSEFREMPAENGLAERLIAAGSGRGRAVAMTTIAAILALAMLALGIGQGAGMLQPLAIAIIGGLAAQVPLVLFVLPALLLLLHPQRTTAADAGRQAR